MSSTEVGFAFNGGLPRKSELDLQIIFVIPT
jgi:hypothetical protein